MSDASATQPDSSATQHDGRATQPDTSPLAPGELTRTLQHLRQLARLERRETGRSRHADAVKATIHRLTRTMRMSPSIASPSPVHRDESPLSRP